MAGTVHVFEFLEKTLAKVPLGMAVIFGADRFLKRLALKHLIRSVSESDESDYAATIFDSDNAQWVDVHDELATRSLFADAGPRIVAIDHADRFVKEHRERLEDYLNPPKPKSRVKTKSTPKLKSASKSEQKVEKQTPEPGQKVDPQVVATAKSGDSEAPSFTGLLVLIVDNWLSTTRLFKEVEKKGLQIKCDPPLQGRSKNRDEKRVGQWLIERAKQEYQLELTSKGAQLVIDLTDGEFGRMDQELQKLEVYQEPNGTLPLETIKQAVGGWQTNTTWEAIDAATDGDAKKALQLIDRLLRGGEHPLALFGQISVSLRRYSTATEIVLRQLRGGERPDIGAALKSAGFPFWGNELGLNEKRLKRIGSKRAVQISQWLLEADMSLKRSHSKEEMGRSVLENLLIRIASD